MLIQLPEHGPVLVDDCRLPRYWATVWTMLHGADLAPSTLKRKLGHIEALYAHTEALGGNLDDALAELDLTLLGNALEAFFVLLRNVPGRLKAALDAAQARPAGTIGRDNQIAHATERIKGLETLLSTQAGEQVFPDGPDLSQPDQRRSVLSGT